MTAAKTPTMDGFRVAPDISVEIARWLSHLGAERRMSAKTLDAYQRDVSQFLSFLTGHLGSAPTLKQLAKYAPQSPSEMGKLQKRLLCAGFRNKEAITIFMGIRLGVPGGNSMSMTRPPTSRGVPSLGAMCIRNPGAAFTSQMAPPTSL